MMHAFALLRAFVGIPSITSILLIADLIARPRLRLLSGDRRLLLGFAAAAAVVLYPSALGLVPVDLYRIGFAPVAPLILATVAAFLAHRHRRCSCAVLAILIAFDLHLLGGTNLWDYLVDPYVGVIGLVWAALRASSAIVEVRSAVEPWPQPD
jgi:hypothetical protein